MQIDVNNYFVAEVVPEIYVKNPSFKNQLDVCFFVTHCTNLNKKAFSNVLTFNNSNDTSDSNATKNHNYLKSCLS